MERMHPYRLTRRAALAAPAVAPMVAPVVTRAQAWPTRPLVLVVPSTAGGSLDTLTRLLAERLGPALDGATVIVENRGGAGGAIGAEHVARSPPDGHRVLLGAVHHAILPAVTPQLPYDSRRDLAPVTGIGASPNALVVHPGVPADSVAALVAYARENPQRLNVATGGRGTLHHLTAALFAKAAGITLTPVHYRGSGPAITDLLAGQVQLMFETMPSAAQQIRAGTLRALAVTSASRTELFPTVPTLAESGFPGVTVATWYGLFAPAATPPGVLERLRDATAAALETPALQAAWRQNGVAGGGEPVAAFTAFWQAELLRWAGVARDAGVTLE